MTLRDEVLVELATLGASERAIALVDSALRSDEALAASIEGTAPTAGDAEVSGASPTGSSVYLSEITVAGFRGIGPEATISFEPGPGLTVVVGRNGSGKSSFADGLEVALTGDSYRWRDKSSVWKQGWRNLHAEGEARVSAKFLVDGHRGGTTVERSWPTDVTDVDAATDWAQHHGETRSDLRGLGWATPIELYRPILSYSELGVILSNPSTLFDTLSAVLGLEQLVEAGERIRKRRLDAEKLDKDAKKRLKDILVRLEESDDPRAAECVDALSGRTWDLEAARKAVTLAEAGDPSLRALTMLEAPDQEEVDAVITELRDTSAALSALEGTDTARARRIINLLETAIEHRDHTGDTECPVCGSGQLDAAWLADAHSQIAELSEQAGKFDAAGAAHLAATKRAMAIARPVGLPEEPQIDTSELRSASAALAAAPNAPIDLGAHLEATHPPYREALGRVVEAAKAEHSASEDQWRPLALMVATWLEEAENALASRDLVADLKSAEALAKEATDTLRRRRFGPIAEQAVGLWNQLRLQSNVELTAVDLSGSGTRRRVDLAVNVDGTEGAALGVVSQGEINCLALSLFFPRATLPDSPFRFIVIDDPVQAMDPARVDGLARVFADLAIDRQLIVFTHDDRLPESLRRLGLTHSLLEVTRRPGSIVETRRAVDPVIQYFQDAWATAKDENLPDGVADRVVPGMCRMGVEAACHTKIRKNLLGHGLAHTDVENRIAEATTLHQITALALFDDVGQTAKVLNHLNSWGRDMGDAFQACNKGSHGPYRGSLTDLTNDARSLSQRIVNA